MTNRLDEILASSSYSNYVVNNASVPKDALVFLYPSWSSYYAILHVVLNCMRDLSSNLTLYIYDIESQEYGQFSTFYNIKSNGMGEIVFLKDTRVLSILKTYSNNAESDIKLFLRTITVDLNSNRGEGCSNKYLNGNSVK